MEKKLEIVKIGQVIPYKNNPRINDEAAKEVARSISECGYCNPIIVDENMVIMAGNTRYKAIVSLGWEECQVMVVTGLTEDQKKKYRLYDNKTGEFAEWDTWRLAQEIEDLDFSGFNFSFDLPHETEEFGGTEFINREYGDDAFSDEEFDYECPECGFRFNKK